MSRKAKVIRKASATVLVRILDWDSLRVGFQVNLGKITITENALRIIKIIQFI